jgi:phosphate transport system ATP-binding protein
MAGGSSTAFSAIMQERSRSGRGPDGTERKTKFEVRDWNFWYGSKQALFSISLKIPERSVMALIGPSGCGKSTFLCSMNRMNDFVDNSRHEGLIALDGHDINARDFNLVSLRRRVGMVFQKSNPFPKSIFENVIFGQRVAGQTSKQVLEEICELCLKRAALWNEVKDRLDDSALALSGGQAQRLCIARALATNPEVLLLDEPASALDPASTARIEDLIFELKENYTIIIVTHNMQQAARVSDQTAFFFEGKLVESGPTQQLYTRPSIKQTEDYITGRFG